MTRSLSLALYLATRARTDRATRRDATRKALESNDNIVSERLGQATAERPDGALVWLHTGDDADALAARELARRLKAERDDLGFLLTSGAPETPVDSSDCVVRQHVPDDSRPAVRRFLDHWRPDVAVWTEPDLRPALVTETARRGTPLYLVDARTARPDPAAWRWRRGMSGALLGRFARVLTGDEDSAQAYRRMGALPQRIETVGYLEEGTPPPPCDEAERARLADALAGRPVWLAMGVTAGERDAVLAAHAQAQRRAHRLLLILVPADPSLGAEWAAALERGGWSVARRGADADPDADRQVYLADTDGEAGLWYRLAPIAFLGQSLEAGGGINPFEAAALGSAILHGPNVRSHRAAFDRLAAVGAARLVKNADDLGAGVEALLSPETAAALAHEAWRVSTAGAEVTDRVIALIHETLDAGQVA